MSTRPLLLVPATFAVLLAALTPTTWALDPAGDTQEKGVPMQPGDLRTGEGRFPFEESVLENGLRVISLEDHSTPIVAVQLWYHVGSKDEQVDRQGFAHMFEHMMFRGTDRLGPKDHFDYIKRTGGNTNAYTAFDQTVYVEELPSNQLEMVLWLEAERMASLKIDEGGFATERKVVEEERRLGLNAPYGSVAEKALDALFTEHPYRWSPIGKIEHLRAAGVDDIQHFWDTYYVPNNATLVVVGDVTHGQVRKLAQKNFGWIPRCPEPPRVTVREPEQTELRTITIQADNGPVPIAGVVFRTVEDGHPDALPVSMLMQILGGGESSRLYIDLVRRKQLAEVALAAGVTFEQAGLAITAGVMMPFGDTSAVIDAIWEQVKTIKSEGVTEDELAKVRNQLYRSNVTESLTIASKASALGNAAVIQGDAQLANTYLDRVQTVSREDIKRVANTYLVKTRANEMTIKPTLMSSLKSLLSLAGAAGAAGGDDTEAGADDAEEEVESGARGMATGPKADAERAAWFADAPPVAPPLAVSVDVAGTERVLDNGLRMIVVENHEVPFVSASLQLRAGAYTQDETFPATASMATQMITRGTFAHDAETLAAELEKRGISLSADAGHDSASVSVSSVKREFETMLRFMSEVVQVPAFDAEEFETLRRQTSVGMAISEKDPSAIADRAFAAALWGSHPYGHPSAGTSADLANLEIERLQEWWESYVRPESAVLYVAGDVTPDEAERVANRFLGGWEVEGDATDPRVAPAEPQGALRIVLVDKPGAIQSEIRAGHEGIDRGHELHPESVVLGQVLGGGFNSRLNDSLRVQKGLTYGAGGGLTTGRFGGSLRLRTFTKTPTTGETVRALIDEVERLRAEPPTAEEVTNAVSYLAGSFAGSLETPQSVAGRLWTQELMGLPADYWSSYLGRIAATTPESVARAANELVDPGRLLIVVVGDAAKVKAELEAIGPVEVVKEG